MSVWNVFYVIDRWFVWYKTKGSFTSQTALEKLIYLAIKNISKKWNMPVPNWSLIVGQLDIFFASRLKLDLA